MSFLLIALILPSIISLGATQSAPALAYARATSEIRSTDGKMLMVPSSLRTPQWPWEVYSQRQTSHAIYSVGYSSRSFLIARITGPFSSSAGEPLGSLNLVRCGETLCSDQSPFHNSSVLRIISHSAIPSSLEGQ